MAWTNLPWCLHFSRGTDLLSTGELPLQGAKNWWFLQRILHTAPWLTCSDFVEICTKECYVQSVASRDGTFVHSASIDATKVSSLYLHFLEALLRWFSEWMLGSLDVLVFLRIKKQTSAIQDELPFDSNLTQPMFALTLWGQCYELTEKGTAHPQVHSTHDFCTEKMLREISTKSVTLSEANHVCFMLNIRCCRTSRELTCPTLVKGKSSKHDFWWDMLVPRRVGLVSYGDASNHRDDADDAAFFGMPPARILDFLTWIEEGRFQVASDEIPRLFIVTLGQKLNETNLETHKV